jgi:hypothetical protein
VAASLTYTTTVHMSDGKPLKTTLSAARDSSLLAPTALLSRQDRERGSLRLIRQFQTGFKLSAEDLPVRLSATIS